MDGESLVNERQKAFAGRAIRRERLFLVLSVLGVTVGIGVFAWAIASRFADPNAPYGARLAIAVLVLLNARQNLRQARFAGILRTLLPAETA